MKYKNLMRRLNLIISIIAILAVIYTALSWYTGNVIANNIDSKIIDIEYNINRHQKLLKFYTSYSDYHQGIFSTTFYLKITAKNALLDDTDPNVIFNEQITVYHGPFPWSELKEFNFNPQIASAVYVMTEKNSPKLWQIANYQPFLNAKLTIRYDKSMQFVINTLPVDHINLSDKTLYKISAGHLIVNSDSTFNEFNLTSGLENLKIKDKKLDINLNDFQLELLPSSDQSTNTTYQLTSSIKQLLIDRSLSQQYKRGIELNGISFNSTFEKLAQVGFNFNNILNINKIQLNNYLDNIAITDISITNQNKSNDELTLFGNIDSTIGNITLGKQDLGFSGAGISYENLSITANDSIPDNNMQTSKAEQTYTKLTINKYFWQNAHGVINMNSSMLLNHIDLSKIFFLSDLQQNNIVSLDFSLNIPFAPLIYQFAQIQHPEKNTLSKSDLQYAYQSIMLLSALLQNASPIELIYDATPIKQPGIYSTLHYDSINKQATINGKKVKPSQFFSKLKLIQ
jgi:uncharacterized protein YdgA (DUF945 family)